MSKKNDYQLIGPVLSAGAWCAVLFDTDKEGYAKDAQTVPVACWAAASVGKRSYVAGLIPTLDGPLGPAEEDPLFRGYVASAKDLRAFIEVWDDGVDEEDEEDEDEEEDSDD